MVPARRKGYTAIELIAAISILFVLIALAFVGMRQFGNQGKEQATKVMLENCRSMLDELAARTKLQGLATAAVKAPGDVTADTGFSNRYYHPSLTASYSTFGAMNRIPANATVIGRLPTDQTERRTVPDELWREGAEYKPGEVVGTVSGGGKIQWYHATQPHRSNVDNAPFGKLGNRFWIAFDSSQQIAMWAPKKNYAPTDRVRVPSGGTYMCIAPHMSDPMLTNMPPNPQFWVPCGIGHERQALILLDGWKNPILFVPAGGLQPVNPSGMPVGQPLRSPAARPFFASAGPDGDFNRTDDNLYSNDTIRPMPPLQ